MQYEHLQQPPLNFTVKGILCAPTAKPSNGDLFIVDSSETVGDFIGHEGDLAYFGMDDNRTWVFIQPRAGYYARVVNVNGDRAYQYVQNKGWTALETGVSEK